METYREQNSANIHESDDESMEEDDVTDKQVQSYNSKLKNCGKNPTVNDIFANFKEIELFTTMNATKINTKN